MVITKTGDLFNSASQTLVNTVNCVGVMGKGVALGFKQRFPDMFQEYVRLCEAGRVKIGQPYLYKQLAGPWVLNFPTKDHWRSVSKLSDIVDGLNFLERHYNEWGITSLAVPPLGCGQGGLEWRVVGPTLYRHLQKLDIPIELFAPHGTIPFELTQEFLGSADRIRIEPNLSAPPATKISPSWLALIEILERVVKEPYHWPVGRTTFQKIVYFATESGIPTGFTFTKSSYGPFSEDVKPMLSKLVNHGLIREERLGRMLAVEPGPTFSDARKAFPDELEKWDQPIEHVADLFMRVRTNQAEIAASVFFIARTLGRDHQVLLTEDDVLQGVLEWKIKRKPPIEAEEVARTIRNLNILRWVKLTPSELPIPAEA
jgi:O-acetyl-ADP-ribose deacetylase (regulator of RNase III)